MEVNFKKDEGGTDNINKKLIIGVVGLILLGILVFVVLSIYNYMTSPERELELGAEIDKVAINEDGRQIYIKLKGGTNEKEIKRIKFIFEDTEENEYSFETAEGAEEINVSFDYTWFDALFKKPDFNGIYNYKINASEADLENFDDIEIVKVRFYYEEEEEEIETETLDTEEPTSPPTTGSGGGGGGGGNGGNGGGPAPTPETEICNDLIDNDEDSDVDCADSDCDSDSDCNQPSSNYENNSEYLYVLASTSDTQEFHIKPNHFFIFDDAAEAQDNWTLYFENSPDIWDNSKINVSDGIERIFTQIFLPEQISSITPSLEGSIWRAVIVPITPSDKFLDSISVFTISDPNPTNSLINSGQDEGYGILMEDVENHFVMFLVNPDSSEVSYTLSTGEVVNNYITNLKINTDYTVTYGGNSLIHRTSEAGILRFDSDQDGLIEISEGVVPTSGLFSSIIGWVKNLFGFLFG